MAPLSLPAPAPVPAPVHPVAPVMAAQPAAPLTGHLRGIALDIFTGNRAQSENFRQQFNMYRSLNDQHKVMMSPYYRTMQALFLIKGPAVNDWTNDQVEALVTRVNHPQNPIGCDEEILWTNFGTAFDGTFTNTTKKQKAHATIQQIQMKGDDLDSYIAAFKRLAKEAGYALDAA